MPDQLGLASVSELRDKPWNSNAFQVPKEIFEVPGMLSYQEKRMLYYVALRYFIGRGAIVDLGAFLGGSTICFAAALKQRGFHQPLIHSYDLFKLGDFERERYFPQNPPPALKTRSVFDSYLSKYTELLRVYEGDVLGFPWTSGPIE